MVKFGAKGKWGTPDYVGGKWGVIDRSGNSKNYSINFALGSEVERDAVYHWGTVVYLYAIFSASLIVAYLAGFKYLITGSEHSADDPNLIYKGVEVNHQAEKFLFLKTSLMNLSAILY